MSEPNFKSRVKEALTRVIEPKKQETPQEWVPPWLSWNPDAVDRVDSVVVHNYTAEERDMRAGHLSEDQIESFKALARIKTPPLPAVRPHGAVNGITSWAGAR